MSNSNNESDSEELAVMLLRETEKAYLLKHIHTEKEAWFPKSQISFEYFNPEKLKGSVVIPTWLLEKKVRNNSFLEALITIEGYKSRIDSGEHWQGEENG